MPDYHTELIFRIDTLLLFVCAALILIMFAHMLITEQVERRSKRRLWQIKKNVFSVIASGQALHSPASSQMLPPITLNEFLDIEMNRIREAAFFNADEQHLLKDCFLIDKTIAEAKKTAVARWGKWRRVEAILLLGYAETPDAVKVLKKTAFDADEDIAYFSIKALGRIKTRQSAELLAGIFVAKNHLRRAIASLLDGFPDGTVELFLPMLKSRQPALRLWAFDLTGRYGIRRHADAVRPYATDPSEEIRAAACKCLGRIGGRDCAGAIEHLLGDASWLVRAHAVTALAEILGAGSFAKVMPLINDSSLTVLASVKKALTDHIGEALPYLEVIFGGNDALAKKIALEALEASGHLKTILDGALGPSGERCRRCETVLKGILGLRSYGGLAPLITASEEKRRGHLLALMRRLDDRAACEIENLADASKEKGGAS